MNNSNLSDFGAPNSFFLPEDYKSFLMNFEAFDLKGRLFYVDSLDQYKEIVSMLNYENLQTANATMDNQNLVCPSNFLVIGRGIQNGLLLLGRDPSCMGVWYFDPPLLTAYNDPDENLYLVSDSFSQFLALLKKEVHINKTVKKTIYRWA